MTSWDQFFTANEMQQLSQLDGNVTSSISPLFHQSLLSIHGPDARKFLQGQVTCDINQLTSGNFIRGAQCTLKGRVILSFAAFAPNTDTLILRISSDLREKAAQNLKKYMVFSKASLTDLNDEYLGFFITQEATLSMFATLLNVEIAEADCLHFDGITLAKTHPNAWELWISTSRLSAIWESLKPQLTFGSPYLKTLADIAAGEPEIDANSYELFTPHSLNYPLSGAVSFKKGCYTGQEIVARMHYRGNLQKHAYHFEIDLPQTELPPPGSALQDETGANKGELILSAPRSPTSAELLVYVGDTETDNLYWKEQKLRVLPLPYAIPVTQE